VDEGRPEGLPVAEEVVPERYKLGLDLDAEQAGRLDAVVGELAQVLREAAAYVQEALGGFGLETREDEGVARLAAEGEVDEAELAYAWPGEDVPDFVALDWGRVG
jgi:hypothetical protein